MIRAVVCVDREWGIGKGNGMLFSLSKDMKFFRETTSGHTVVMGGNTLRSFPNQKPLKNRVNIVLTRGQVCDECVVVHSYEELIAEMKSRKNEEIFVIGGGEVYKTLLSYCHEAIVTKVDGIGGAEVFFPNLDVHSDFTCVDEGTPVEDNGYSIRFTRYVNRAVKNLP